MPNRPAQGSRTQVARAPLCACINVLLITCVATIRQQRIPFPACALLKQLLLFASAYCSSSSCHLCLSQLSPGRILSLPTLYVVHGLNFQAGYPSACPLFAQTIAPRKRGMPHAAWNVQLVTINKVNTRTHTHLHTLTHMAIVRAAIASITSSLKPPSVLKAKRFVSLYTEHTRAWQTRQVENYFFRHNSRKTCEEQSKPSNYTSNNES